MDSLLPFFLLCFTSFFTLYGAQNETYIED